ncbi:MAG TPA: hypothetical protein VN772_01090, partial [Solirubrobacteraceae bacterium]|nr:hypothetical protein [Solirubrobacteraceae bacterium]
MISSEVQRTLVKSPPELWAELSDPVALGRHLGELGEIRITRAEPEHTVEWRAGDTNGTVLIRPSGWGTKVTLSATRQLLASEAPTPASEAPPVEQPPAPREAAPVGEAAPATTELAPATPELAPVAEADAPAAAREREPDA